MEKPIYTVTRLNRLARGVLEQELGSIWLSGEISNLAQPSSGHWYFSLKDPGAQIRCAMFKGRSGTVTFRPKEGDQVLVEARLTVYEPRGDMQLIVERMQPAGAGLLALRFEALKEQLAQQGLFAPERKRPLPVAPQRVGLITSATGAAIYDMLSVFKRRAPQIELVIYPTAVQGEAAISQIVSAIMTANRRHEVELLILARGGGSLEDLWCFNEEAVARAIAASKLPIVSAIGHEVDVTISDLVADLRAPTPSAAAELVAPDNRQKWQQLATLQQRLQLALVNPLRQRQHRWSLLNQRLSHQDPQRRLQQQSQRLDELERRLTQNLERCLYQQQRQVEVWQQRLQQRDPRLTVAHAQNRLDSLEQRLYEQCQQLLTQRQHRLHLLSAELNAVSPLATLGRGYALIYDEAGQLVRSRNAIVPKQRLRAHLAEGELWVTAD